MKFYRPPQQSQPHEYITNAGFFESAPLGKYLSPKEAYRFYKSLVTIPEGSLFSINKFCSALAITSVTWNGLYKLGVAHHPAIDQYNRALARVSDSLSFVITSKYIHDFDSICHINNFKATYVVIPNNLEQKELSDIVYLDTLKAKKLFKELPISYPSNLRKNDFEKRDYHFNNAGSLKFAEYLDSLIRKSNN